MSEGNERILEGLLAQLELPSGEKEQYRDLFRYSIGRGTTMLNRMITQQQMLEAFRGAQQPAAAPIPAATAPAPAPPAPPAPAPAPAPAAVIPPVPGPPAEVVTPPAAAPAAEPVGDEPTGPYAKFKMPDLDALISSRGIKANPNCKEETLRRKLENWDLLNTTTPAPTG